MAKQDICHIDVQASGPLDKRAGDLLEIEDSDPPGINPIVRSYDQSLGQAKQLTNRRIEGLPVPVFRCYASPFIRYGGLTGGDIHGRESQEGWKEERGKEKEIEESSVLSTIPRSSETVRKTKQ